jgi:hypothetical protein
LPSSSPIRTSAAEDTLRAERRASVTTKEPHSGHRLERRPFGPTEERSESGYLDGLGRRNERWAFTAAFEAVA